MKGRRVAIIGAGFGGLSAAVLLANAGHDVIVLEAAEKADIPLVFNLPYRPDLNGIELLWRKAKNTFYRLMDSFRVNGVHASVAGTV